jgi:hypothetical protein
MDFASYFGQLKTVKWLHYNHTEGWTFRSMDNDASQNHLKLLEWLHVSRNEGCTTEAANIAAFKGLLDVVKWLYKKRRTHSSFNRKCGRGRPSKHCKVSSHNTECLGLSQWRFRNGQISTF